MTTITLTFHDGEETRFKRTLFAEEAWAALKGIDAILHETCKPIDKLDAVRDVLADVIWRDKSLPRKFAYRRSTTRLQPTVTLDVLPLFASQRHNAVGCDVTEAIEAKLQLRRLGLRGTDQQCLPSLE